MIEFYNIASNLRSAGARQSRAQADTQEGEKITLWEGDFSSNIVIVNLY